MLPTERIARFFRKPAVVYALLMAQWPVLMFFLKLAVVYVLLMGPWSARLQEGYAVLYRGAGNVLFGSLGSVGTARFLALTGAGQAFDSQIVLRTRDSAGVRSTRDVPFHTRRTGYLPTAELVALILATPIPWWRRWKALAWGILGIIAFVALEAGITILYSLTDVRLPALDVTPSTSKVCVQIYEIMVVSPTVSLVIPVLVWLLVSFRRSDWDRVRKDTHGRVGRRKEKAT